LQVFGLVVMVGCAAAIWSLAAAPQFAARKLEIRGARFTAGEAVQNIVGLERSANLFALRTDQAVERLAHLPAVVSARVEVRLPDTVTVTLEERTPRMVWVIGDKRYVVDDGGVLFGMVDAAGNPIPSTAGPIRSAPTPVPIVPLPTSTRQGSSPAESASAEGTTSPAAPTASAKGSPHAGASTSPGPISSMTPRGQSPSLKPVAAGDTVATPGPSSLALPVVYDRQAADAPLDLGSIVDPVTLDAGYRLAGRTPKEVGSTATRLIVVVDDEHGFTMSSVPAGWVAEFGFYTPTLRQVTVIPTQIDDLRIVLLNRGEAHVAWVWLMSDISEDHVVTVLPR
jgi:hypothetical protein